MYRVLAVLLISNISLFGCAGSLSKDLLLSNQGLQEISKRNYSQAEKYLNQSLALNPDNPYALLNLGVVYQNTDQPEKAREMYKKVIALNPKAEAGHSNMESGVGKTLGDIALSNLKFLERKKNEKVASKNAPLYRVTTASLDQKRNTLLPKRKKFPLVHQTESISRTYDRAAVVPRRETTQNSKKFGGTRWAVNVSSVQDPMSIAEPAFTLMKKGYHTYLTNAHINGERWVRLRVGFFKSYRDAVSAREDILFLIPYEKTSWVVKVSKGELNKYNGYYY